MRRRRKKYKRKYSWLDDIDWSVDPEKAREIGAVILLIVGVVFLLSIFGVAGKAGIAIVHFLDYAFGILGYLIPFILLILGYMLWNPKKFELRAVSWIGGVIFLIFFPALIAPHGGVIGLKISEFLKNYLGEIATFLILLGMTAIGIILLFNLSLKALYESFVGKNENEEANDDSPKVSVFTTLKNSFANKNNGAPVVGEVGQTKVVASTVSGDWKYPSLDMLEFSTGKATSGNIAKNVDIIQKTLADFGIEVTMGDVNIGPTVTQYTFKPVEGVKLNQIVARQNDLALALAAHPIRLEAPIPGKSAVGVEVPNKVPAIVTIREVLETDDFKNAKSNLTIALGRDVAGKPIVIDLKKMPHLLVAGATGTGKSIAINGIITSLLYRNSPDDLRLMLVDPKRVEFTPYNDIPHLLTPVVTEPDQTLNALKWAVAEMERRYKLLSENGKRDIISYNENPGEPGKLPYIVIVIDELADLMMKSAKEVEGAIVRISQMARAVGIHLVIATQRPSVNVITGLIKANINSRISFAVASQIDSRTVLDQSGAEKLLGKGDMLYISPEFGKPKRVQGVMISEKEIKSVTGFLKNEGKAQYDEGILDYGVKSASGVSSDGSVDDDMYQEARDIVVSSGKASASYLQRRLRVGYARAARLLDIMEEQGVVGPANGAKPRDVLQSADNEFPTEVK